MENISLKIQLLVTNPEQLFNLVKKEKGIGEACVFFLLALGASVVASIVVSSIVGLGFAAFGAGPALDALLAPAFAILGIPLGFLFAFIFVGIVLLSSKMFGPKLNGTEVFKAYAYGFSLSTVLSVIPFIGWLAWIYSYYLFILGNARLNFVPMSKVILVSLMPLIFFLALIILIIILALLFVFGMGIGF